MNIRLPKTGKKMCQAKNFNCLSGENIPTIRQHINPQIFTKCPGHLIKTIHSKPNIILTPSQQIQAINIGTEWRFLHSATVGQKHCLPHTCLLCDTTTLFHRQAISQPSLSSYCVAPSSRLSAAETQKFIIQNQALLEFMNTVWINLYLFLQSIQASQIWMGLSSRGS